MPKVAETGPKTMKRTMTLTPSTKVPTNRPPTKEAVSTPRPKAKKDLKVTKAVETTPKAKKDPLAPKRAKSAYIFFATEEGTKVRLANPEMSPPDVLREVGRRWKELSDNAKAVYEKMSEEDKDRYKEEMESYSPPASPVADKKAKKDPNAPKPALSSYNFFSKVEGKKFRDANPGLKTTEYMKELGARWTKLDDAARKPWVAMAEEDKKRFEREKQPVVNHQMED